MTTSSPRAVFDTNIVLSAVIREDSVPFQALLTAKRLGRVLLSMDTESELQDVFRRPKFNKYIPEDERLEFLETLIDDSEFIEITEVVTECRDPKDNKFLELAVSGSASHIITGDADLLVMNPFRGISIVSAQEFLASLSEIQ